MQVCSDCLKETDEVWPPRDSDNACTLDPVHPNCEACGKSAPCYRVTFRDGKKIAFAYPESCICGLIHMPPHCPEMFYASKCKPCKQHEKQFIERGEANRYLSCPCGLAYDGYYMVGRRDKGPGMGLVLEQDAKARARQLQMMNEAYYIGLKAGK